MQGQVGAWSGAETAHGALEPALLLPAHLLLQLR